MGVWVGWHLGPSLDMQTNASFHALEHLKNAPVEQVPGSHAAPIKEKNQANSSSASLCAEHPCNMRSRHRPAGSRSQKSQTHYSTYTCHIYIIRNMYIYMCVFLVFVFYVST